MAYRIGHPSSHVTFATSMIVEPDSFLLCVRWSYHAKQWLPDTMRIIDSACPEVFLLLSLGQSDQSVGSVDGCSVSS